MHLNQGIQVLTTIFAFQMRPLPTQRQRAIILAISINDT